jgi:DNA-binding response OmpR family regulator
MLTARGQEADRRKAREAGVEAYLIKPFSPLELIKQVQAVLGT